MRKAVAVPPRDKRSNSLIRAFAVLSYLVFVASVFTDQMSFFRLVSRHGAWRNRVSVKLDGLCAFAIAREELL